ncbi:hypothetical protein LIER_44113 [Lithospermum erythrorhizon]|uniref:Uncharacterized protein n=1 Tax=Lithospermum erythrorhizon TaxID=34254 RepID=A0AAV3PRP6_LITER
MESKNIKVVDQDISTEDEEEQTIMPTVNTSPTDRPEEDVQTSTPTENDSEIEPAARIQKNHPVNNIIGQLDQGMTTSKKDKVDYKKMIGLLEETYFISKEEPKDVKTGLLDEHWINAMEEELVQFEKNEVWKLVPRPDDHNVIGTK